MIATLLRFGFLIAAIVVLHAGCSEPARYTTIEVDAPGMVAEELANLWPPLYQLGVVYDQRATFYYSQPLAEVDAIIREHNAGIEGVSFTAPKEMAGTIPTAPNTEIEDHLTIHLDGRAMDKLGVTAATVSKAVSKKMPDKKMEMPIEEKFELYSNMEIPTRDGETVLLKKLGEIQKEQRLRPIIRSTNW